MNGVKARKILGFLLLPQVIPRARTLFASGFGYIAFLIASIYGGVRLLPRTHPYLNPANIGKFGIRHVIGEAANNLILKKENADQIAVFAAVMVGMLLLLMQIVLIIYMVVLKPAFAGTSFFLTPDPGGGTTPDIAFIVLDRVFGIPDLFCTVGNICTDVAAGMPWPFHTALHEMFRFYSLGILIIGVIIFLYYIVVIVGETATTGSPFGQRFQNTWTPIRLVVALGLLIPLNYGLNSGQYIVLYAAKYGSGFATNAWHIFNSTLDTHNAVFTNGPSTNPSGERQTLLAKPMPVDMMPVVQMMTIVHACAYAYWKLDPNTAARPATATSPAYTGMPRPPNPGFYIKPYLVKLSQPWMTDANTQLEVTGGTTYVQALDFYNNSDIIIRFGRYDANNPENYGQEKGSVAPLCGDVRIPITYVRTRGQGATVGGADQMQEWYFETVKNMWFQDGLIRALPQRFMEFALNRDPDEKCIVGCAYPVLPACFGANAPCQTQQPSGSARQTLVNEYNVLVRTEIHEAWQRYNTNANDIQMTVEILERGWAGAGIWYNTIADINGAFITAVTAQPYFSSYPHVMEEAREQRRKNDSDPSPKMQFVPNIANGQTAQISGGENALGIAQKLADFFRWWNDDEPNNEKADKTVTGSAFSDTITSIFGTAGLFAMRGDNAHIHPLAQLAAVGKSLVESAIANVGRSTITAGLGGLMRVLEIPAAGPVANFLSSMAMTVAFLALVAGFILYYVLPFLPFLYFFFAFGTWVKSIFEAMVGVPLWALAHLRLDGEGLPGDSASGGYFLIFEIFIRPILTVFGLVAAVLILTAQVRVLNVIWMLVIDNLTGFEGWSQNAAGTGQEQTIFAGNTLKTFPRNTIDQFFFTIVYTIIVYMMATASFKMIDKIPDQLLRFMGAGVSAFSDINPDPTEGLTRYAAVGGITVGQQATQGVKGLIDSVGGTLEGQLKNTINAAKAAEVPKP